MGAGSAALRHFFARLFNHAILRTAAVNLISLVATMFTGILLARALGEDGRGMYAALVVWFGAALVLSEVGQSAAVTYFVARSRDTAAETIRRSRQIMMAASSVLVVAGLLTSRFLAGGVHEMWLSYLVVISGLVFNSLFGPYIYALQALSLPKWNLVRVSQPVLNVAAVSVWHMSAHLTVLSAACCLLLSYSSQMLLAWALGRRMVRGMDPAETAPPDDLLRFGLKQASSAVPQTLAGSLDRIVLSQWGNPGVLGQYAVAQSVVSAAAPLGTAIASVMFPRMSAFSGDRTERRQMERSVLKRSTLSMTCAVVLLAGVSPWVIPLAFGPAFVPAAELTPWIAPAVIAQSMLGITGAFLRARGTPGLASRANILALVAGSLTMSVLVPQLGARGAALGVVVGAVCGLTVSLLDLGRSARPNVGGEDAKFGI